MAEETTLEPGSVKPAKRVLGRLPAFSQDYQAGLVGWRDALTESYAAAFHLWRRLILYIGDQHWAKATGEGISLEFDRYPRETIPSEEQVYSNYMGRLFRDLKAMTLKNTPVVQVYPTPGNRGMELKQDALILQNIMRQYFERLWDVPSLLNTVYDWAIPAGYGFTKFRVEDGHVVLDPLTAFSVMPDPVAKSWMGATRFVHQEFMHVEEIWRDFGARLKSDPKFGISTIDDLLSRQTEKLKAQLIIEDYLRLLPNGNEISDSLTEEYMTVEQFYFMPNEEWKEGRMSALVANILTIDEKIGIPEGIRPKDFFNILPFYWQTLQGCILGQGGMECLRTLQMLLDYLDRRIGRKVEFNVSGINVPEGAALMREQEEAAFQGSHIPNEDGQVWKTRGDRPITPFEFRPDFQGLVLLADRYISRMKDLAGVRMPRIASSGKERLIIGAEDEDRLNDPTTNLISGLERLLTVGKNWVFTYENPVYLADLGNCNPIDIERIKKNLDELDVTIAEGSASPKNKTAQALEIFKKAEMMAEMEPRILRVVLELLNERKEYEKLDPEWPHYQRAIWENNQVEMGKEVRVSDEDDDEIHRREHAHWILEAFSKPDRDVKAIDAMKAHMDKHLDQAEAKGANASDQKEEVESKGTGGAAPIDELAGSAASQLSAGELTPEPLQPSITRLAGQP